jgi:hypothetical protein
MLRLITNIVNAIQRRRRAAAMQARLKKWLEDPNLTIRVKRK